MKVIALQNYSDNYTILREGLIYDLVDSVAENLINKEICAESTGNPALTETYTGIEFDKEFCVKLNNNSYVYNSNTERYELGYDPLANQTGGK